MIIYLDTYRSILRHQKENSSETGGILGGCNGIVMVSYYDKGLPTSRRCSYVPNVRDLNAVIRKWQKNSICFMGIYHTHFENVRSLSMSDIGYIERITRNMPQEITQLYFPIIISPDDEMICYIAKIVSGELVVEEDGLEIIENNKKEEEDAYASIRKTGN